MRSRIDAMLTTRTVATSSGGSALAPTLRAPTSSWGFSGRVVLMQMLMHQQRTGRTTYTRSPLEPRVGP